MALTIKAFLTRPDGSNAIHRFTGDFDFDSVFAFLAHVASGAPPGEAPVHRPAIAIEYVDEDGDRVRVACELEWAECLTQYEALKARGGKVEPLKLYVTVGSAVTTAAANVAQPVPPAAVAIPPAATAPPVPSCSPVVVEQEPRDATTDGDAHDCDEPEEDEDFDTMATPDADFEYEHEGPDADPFIAAAGVPVSGTTVVGKGRLIISPKLAPSGVKTMADYRKAIEVANLLFMFDVEERLASTDSASALEPIFRRTVEAGTTASVDINTGLLYRQALELANTFLTAGYNEKGRALLVKLAALFPRDAVVDFNLACVYCVLGKPELAIHHIESAYKNGYRDATAVLEEEDLLLIRDDPRVIRVIEKMAGIVDATQLHNRGVKPGKGESVLGSLFDEGCQDRYQYDDPTGLKRKMLGAAPRIPTTTATTSATSTTVAAMGARSSAETTLPLTDQQRRENPGSHGNTRKENIRIIERMFPSIESGVASRLLRQTNGNVDKAIEILLLNDGKVPDVPAANR